MQGHLVLTTFLAAVPSSTAFAPPTAGRSTAASFPRAEHSPFARPASTRLNAFLPLDDVAALASSARPLLLDGAGFSSAASSSLEVASGGLLTNENIKVAFSVATFFPQFPWLFLILLPNAGVTKKLMGGYGEPPSRLQLRFTSCAFPICDTNTTCMLGAFHLMHHSITCMT